MPSIVDCPTCSRKLRVTDELIGRRVKCPTCGGMFDAALPPVNGSPEAASPAAPSAVADTAPPPPAPDGTETVPIRLSLDEFDKPARPAGSAPVAPLPGRAPAANATGSQRREFMRCPYCNERISAESRRCRFCGEDLDDANEFDIRKRPRVRRDCEPHRGTLILVLGIVSIVIHALGLPLGLPAWIMGKRDLAKMDRGDMDPSGRGSTQAGYICGIIGTILGSLSLLFIVGYIALFAVMVTTAATSKPPAPAIKSAPMQPQPAPLPPPNNQPPQRK